ncbi:transposase [Roseomonas sp. AR75]|uniref:transposase n=1 Tax=Roseomonas sp. AR75 TaxID=2562311 RepID=UPI0014857191|nr:transposase [Roseomonas sp. AR75]
MTDAEWALLRPLVQPQASRRGRPPADARRLWDAIFWVACSREPWRALPERLGRADTAHRALRRHARNGTLDRLLIAASPHPLAGGDFRSLAWRILRAFRRVARLLTMAQLLMAKRLGLATALPCAPEHLPRPHLSAVIHRLMPLVRGARPALLRWMIALHDAIPGERRLWRLRD